MPARKPASLIERHDTADEKAARVASESAMTPKARLPESVPVALSNNPIASREWRRLMRMYNSIDADIVSRLDMGMLQDYCMLLEQMFELDELRKAAVDGWRVAQKILDVIQKRIEDNPEGEIDIKAFAKAQESVNWAYDKIIKVDGRVDRKRALLLQLRQSLYLTPRSRAGVAPAEKPKEEPEDDMTRLLKSSA